MTEVSAEAPRRESLLPIQHDTVNMTVNRFVRFPDTYQAEWRLFRSAEGQKNMAAFMTSTIGQEEAGYHIPFTGDEQRDNYVRGFLVMHRMLRNQAEMNGVDLPDISLGTIMQYEDSVRNATATDFDSELELFLRRRENARRTLANEDIMLVSALNQLTDGVANPDIAFGASEAYQLMKIALARKDDPYSHLYSGKRAVSEEHIKSLKVSDITELIGASYQKAQEFADAREQLFELREAKVAKDTPDMRGKGRHRMGKLAQMKQGVSEVVGVVQDELDAAAQRLITEDAPDAVRLPNFIPTRQTLRRVKEAAGMVVEGVQQGLENAADHIAAAPSSAEQRARRIVQEPVRAPREGKHRATSRPPSDNN